VGFVWKRGVKKTVFFGSKNGQKMAFFGVKKWSKNDIFWGQKKGGFSSGICMETGGQKNGVFWVKKWVFFGSKNGQKTTYL
jgi:hypothetical protein